MIDICTMNKISACGTDRLDPAVFTVTDTLENASGVMVRSASLHEISFPASLYAIARAGAGVNNIPLDACSEQGIVVFNTPGANANAVKELVLAGLFLASRGVSEGIAWAKTLKGQPEVGKLVEKGKGQFVGPEIAGKKLGVIGLGAIGVLVANAALALGMTVYGYDPYLSVRAAWNLSPAVHHVTDVKDLYAACDYISIHVPLNPETRGMLNRDAFACMKDGVRILNFARDSLVDSADMLAALDAGKVACYVVDFPTEEMLDVPHVIAIPHLGASTPESEDNCAVMAADELADYLLNGNITHSVNYPDISAPRITACRICILHKNVPNMLSGFSTHISAEGINIEAMVNRARGAYAYTILDVASRPSEETVRALTAQEGVIRVRIL
ncbi:MAG: phosphoglycerate dehydrogenase [Clostridia bacterium]|nr:phosphoglycerate dehydrogenase [Clostridia bacterium]MDY6184236.1 phosphoglycerate dehydrogenase [Eubacteriales bacterium]